MSLTPGLSRRGLLLVRAQEGRDMLIQGLRFAGQSVVDLPVYRTVAAKGEGAAVEAALLAGSIDGVTFTSSSTVAHFRGLFSRRAWARLAPKVRGICLGPITRRSAEEAGLAIGVEASEASIPALMAALLKADAQPAKGRSR